MLRLEDQEQRLRAGLVELQTSQSALQELGIPILPVMRGVILAIIVGTIHDQQIDKLTQDILQTIKPVSYTHLDVYKRQILHRVKPLF